MDALRINTNLYTLEEAEKIIDYRRRKAYQRKKRKALYYLAQKACGLALIATGFLTIPIDNDITAAVVLVPMGLFIALTKRKVMQF